MFDTQIGVPLYLEATAWGAMCAFTAGTMLVGYSLIPFRRANERMNGTDSGG
ncbi:hypothetical protein BDW22DRAFT_1362483 [Trametopsis cervina]|nr:hypothetical protein BDW22DRAFT_1362483 [Trametopsis cervina]